MKNSNDTLVHDLDADESFEQCKQDIVELGFVPLSKPKWPDKPCAFCGGSSLADGVARVQYIPYTSKPICYSCARLIGKLATSLGRWISYRKEILDE